MIKSTRDVSICFVYKSSPEAFISPLFFKNSFTREGGIFWLALGFLPSYAPVNNVYIIVTLFLFLM